MNKEMRQHSRSNVDFDMRVYTSVKKGSYSVKVANISHGGAFVKSKHLPKCGETISFELFDETFKPFHMGNAKVCRVDENASRDDRGFGLMFYELINNSLIDSASVQ